MVSISAAFLGTAITTGLAVIALSRVAPALNLIDAPTGGRKTHSQPVPVVGGLAIFVALLGGTWFVGIADSLGPFLFALSIVIAIGSWDDVTELRPSAKVAIQIGATAIMIWWGGVQLHSVGDLIGWRSIGLSVFAIPLTIFAMVGVVNSINMLDGIDGLAGLLALVALAWYGLVAVECGLHPQAIGAVLLCGAIAGFLVFNLRFPWQTTARVFLGDAGSLMLGFALGWYAIDLTQGPGRTFPPIAALWVVLLPLADCVSLMVRRLRARKSPFAADRGHIHHYLLARGFTHGQTLAILAGLSVLFGAVGFVGWRLAISEAALFFTFFFGFFIYHAWITREWKRIEQRQSVSSGLPAETKNPVAAR